MGIFSRFRDIVSSNINSMLDRAEDPEKMIKLMIQEMEDTLVEIKASCAGAMASRTRGVRLLEEARKRVEDWSAKAELAVQKGREDLAREALVLKRQHQEQVDGLQTEANRFGELIEQYQKDLELLEDKLESTRQKHLLLVERHVRASKTKRAFNKVREVDTSDAFVRFEQFESRIERMEADSDMARRRRSSKPTLTEEFASLERDEDIEKELETLKKKSGSSLDKK